MLNLVYDAERDGGLSNVGTARTPGQERNAEGAPDADIDAVLESLVESLEELNLSLAKAYIEIVERRRFATSEKQT